MTSLNATPFRNAEDAWFWYCRMQVERNAGFKPNGNGSMRACDIDDIALVVMRLCRKGSITSHHVRVLANYGIQQLRPDRRVDPMGLQVWDYALDRMHTHLAEKQIIEIPQKKS